MSDSTSYRDSTRNLRKYVGDTFLMIRFVNVRKVKCQIVKEAVRNYDNRFPKVTCHKIVERHVFLPFSFFLEFFYCIFLSIFLPLREGHIKENCTYFASTAIINLHIISTEIVTQPFKCL